MKFFEGEKGDFLTTKCGTEGYMAPEIIGGNTNYEGPPVDVFACGVLLYEMYFFAPPFEEACNRQH